MGSDYKDLIERLEKTEGGDRELDALIEIEKRRQQAYQAGLDDTMRAQWRVGPYVGFVQDGPTRYKVPAYTASLDAVIALVAKVLPGWTWGAGIESADTGFASVYPSDWSASDNPNQIEAIAKTPAIALLIAALRAWTGKDFRGYAPAPSVDGEA